MLINYNVQKTYTDTLQVDDPGNFCLRCLLITGDSYFIAVQTRLGKTSILKFGSIIEDLEELGDQFFLSYNIMDFDEKKISKSVDQLINDPRKKILQLMTVELEDVLNNIPNQAKFIFRGEEE